ncbi:MAG: type II secretion system protein GspK [Proteobacteria bacterium]|nr:type II secretion system protein GspK [Pseudomonadota bacterium]
MNWKDMFPKTILLFPIELEEGEPESEKGTKKSRGVAMIVAVMIISLMMMFASDYIVSSSVDLTLASAERDNVKAEYIAKSGANWALWLNLFDYGLDVQFSSAKDPAMTQAKAAIGPLWNKLNDIFSYDMPVDLTKVDKFAALFGLSEVMDSKIIDFFKSMDGELGVLAEDEGGKINLNVCYQNQTNCKIIIAQLTALLGCTEVEREFLKQNNIKPEEVAAKIQDWIDQNSAAEPNSGVSSEDDPYQKRTPTFKSKNSPMDTLDELKIVEDWSSDLHSYFSPYLTVYPFTHSQDKDKSAFKLNVNSMNQEVLKCFFSKELGSPESKQNFVKKYKELVDQGGQVAGDDKALQSLLKDVIGFQPDAAEKGKETDKSNWLTTQSRAFKVRAKGIVGNQTRTVEFNIERQSIAQRKGTTGLSPWRLNGFSMK